MYSPRIISFFDVLGFRDFVLTHNLQDVMSAFHIAFDSVYSAGVRLGTRWIMDWKDQEQILVILEEQIVNRDKPSSSRNVLEDFEGETGWGVLLLSDSLLFYSEKIRDEPPVKSLANAILISRIITMSFFEQRLPVRGGISFGEFYANRGDGIYCGKALIEAYELAESQQWIGTAIAPSAEEYAALLVQNFQFSQPWSVRPGWDLIPWEIPLKSGFREGWVLN